MFLIAQMGLAATIRGKRLRKGIGENFKRNVPFEAAIFFMEDSRFRVSNNPKGGVGGAAAPSTFVQKLTTCASVFVLFGTKSYLAGFPDRERSEQGKPVIVGKDPVGSFSDALKRLFSLWKIAAFKS